LNLYGHNQPLLRKNFVLKKLTGRKTERVLNQPKNQKTAILILIKKRKLKRNKLKNENTPQQEPFTRRMREGT